MPKGRGGNALSRTGGGKGTKKPTTKRPPKPSKGKGY